MSIKADDIQGQALKKDTDEQILLYLKIVAFLLAEQQEYDLNHLIQSMERS